MARKRFSDLERVYDALKLGKVDPSSLPQNLDFVKYAKWREGNGEVRNIVRPPLNGEVEVGVKAFSYDDADDNAKQLVTMSGRSSAFLNGFAPKSKLGLITSGLDEYFKDGGFVPAKARIATIVAAKSPTSKITGRKYKTKIGTAYTIPMGQTTGATRYQNAVNAILTDAVFSGSNATHTASFEPERFRRD